MSHFLVEILGPKHYTVALNSWYPMLNIWNLTGIQMVNTGSVSQLSRRHKVCQIFPNFDFFAKYFLIYFVKYFHDHCIANCLINRLHNPPLIINPDFESQVGNS